VHERSATGGKARTMPHMILKLWPGKSESKRRDSPRKSQVTNVRNYGEQTVSVDIEESSP
jgi:hypothetical protein